MQCCGDVLKKPVLTQTYSFVQHFAGFDPEGFSIWFCDYKYPEENTVNYIVMNKARPRLHSLVACGKFSCNRCVPQYGVGATHAGMHVRRVNATTPAQVGGFLQRIDYVRKYAFGVMCILNDGKGQFPIRRAIHTSLT